ncbi:MAG: class I SAM-dependent methyltransferase [Pirellulaceae bacterium]|nr:class I SAM-dependent methyltransferase [Pirellulaceae bacterium]
MTEELAQLSDIGPGHDILEPSAGTGAILDSCFHLNGDGRLVAVEINPSLVDSLRVRYPLADVRCADFLECNRDLGTFDRIVMNPPFDHGSDVRHIQHARKFSKPGGRLVAICAAGPVQRDALEPVCSEWIDLPQGTFKEQGTNVHTAIVVIDAD